MKVFGLFFALTCALVLNGCAATGETRPTRPEAGAAAPPERLIVVTIDQAASPPPPPAGSTRKDTGWSLGYRARSASQRVAAALAADYGLTAVEAWPIPVLGVHCVVYRLAPGDARETILRALVADARVESAQPMQVFSSLSATPPQGYRALQRNLDLLQVEPAHRWALGRGVRIAVIDTGLDLDHPELVGRVVDHADLAGAPDTSASQDFAADRHGTAVAGVIAGGGAGRMLGVAPAAELLAIKACWPLTPGALEAACNSFTLARALSLALSLSSDIVNLSLSGPPDPLLERLLRQALARRVVLVGAVPEAATDGPRFPTSVPGVIAVRNADAGGAVRTSALSAPGNDILTLAPQARYEFQSGSSLAAAEVSGVIALLLEHERNLSPARIESLLNTDATSPINACAALSVLLRREPCPAAARGAALAVRRD